MLFKMKKCSDFSEKVFHNNTRFNKAVDMNSIKPHNETLSNDFNRV